MRPSPPIYTVAKVLKLMGSKDIIKLAFLVLAQLFNAVLDLFSIILLGIITNLTLVSLQGKSPNLPRQLQTTLSFLGLDKISFNGLIAVLAGITALALVLRSIASSLVTRRVFNFLSFRAASQSVKLYESLLNSQWKFLNAETPSQIQFGVQRSINYLFLGVIGAITVILTESTFLLIMFIGIASVDLGMAAATIIFFTTVAFLQYRRFAPRVEKDQKSSTTAIVKNESGVAETISLFREITLRGTKRHFQRDFERNVFGNAKAIARIQFTPFVMKYWMEISLIIGAMTISAIQFVRLSAIEAISSLVVFLAASSRISPALLRLQVSAVNIRGSIGQGDVALRYLSTVDTRIPKNESSGVPALLVTTSTRLEMENPSIISVKNLSFAYLGSRVLQNVNFDICTGQSVAIVGPSGGGKSTLVNLMIGALSPSTGRVLVEEIEVAEYIKENPGRIGFVSQEPIFFSGTVRRNLLLGLDESAISDSELWGVLEMAQLSEVIAEYGLGLDYEIGPRGNKLSLGQRQRLSIARALVTKPSILFLDEATSSLDIVTEREINITMEKIRQDVTTVTVAHRLSTVKNANLVIYVSQGKILSMGTFESLRKEVKDFDLAAEISGL